MTFTRKFLTPALAACVMALFGGAAQATVAPATLTTFNFSGNCADCAVQAEASSFAVSATLVVQNYTLGNAFTLGNFVSFSYGQTNLFGPLNWGQSDVSAFDGSLSGNPADLTGTVNIFSVVDVNQMQTYFSSASLNHAYLVGQDVIPLNTDKDNGTGAWSTTVPDTNNVPEPGSLLLAGAALAALGLARRRKD